MESGDFRRAISNGLGRAVLWLKDHAWQPHRDAIEHVCLHDTSYDPQCDGGRAQYAFEIVRLTNDVAYFAGVAARGLLEAKEHWDVCHLFCLNRLFAQAGDARAREAMYERFRRNDGREKFIGEFEIIELDGVEGLLSVMEQMGLWMEGHTDYVADETLLRRAEDWVGAEGIAVVREAAKSRPAIRRCLEAVEKQDQESSQRHEPDYRNFTYAELRARILDSEKEVPRGWLFGWGKRASEEAIRMAAEDLLREQEERVLVAYLRIFALREFTLDHARLIELGDSRNKEVAIAAVRALQKLKGEDVREFALRFLAEKRQAADGLQLLANNYREGDQLLIESVLDSSRGEDDFHWAGHSAIDVFEINARVESATAMMKVYERGRCTNCRRRAIAVMRQARVLPKDVEQECRYDSDEGIRKMFLPGEKVTG